MLLPFQGAPMKIRLIPRVSLRLPWAMRLLGFQPAHFAPLTVSSACPLRLPWAMRSLGFAMHYWLHLSNSSMLDCIRFERSFSPFETKSETLVKYRSSKGKPMNDCSLLDRYLYILYILYFVILIFGTFGITNLEHLV